MQGFIGRFFKKSYFRNLFADTYNLIYYPFHLFRLAPLFDFRFLQGKSLGPIIVSLEITQRCNLRCKMCWITKGGVELQRKLASEEMPTEAVKKLIDESSRFHPFIYISGGEPLIRRDIFEIIEYIKSKKLFCTLLTNGTLINGKVADRLLESRLDIIQSSIDGVEEIHDQIRGKGAFNKVVTAVKGLTEKKKEKGKSYPIISINCTISPHNYQFLLEVVSIAKNLGIDRLSFSHLWFIYPDFIHHLKRNSLNTDYHWIGEYIIDTSNIDVNLLASEIRQIKKINTSFDVTFFPELNDYEIKQYYSSPSSPIKGRCVYPWFFASIKSNGDVTPCPDHCFRDYVLGNIQNESFIEIWNGEKAKRFRNTLREKRLFPFCLRCCGLFRR